MTPAGASSAEGGVRLTIWGAGGSAPTGRADRARFGGDTVCFEIRREAPDAPPLIVDLGSAARDLGRALTFPPPDAVLERDLRVRQMEAERRPVAARRLGLNPARGFIRGASNANP